MKKMNNKIKKIHIFDFDGTLADTPTPDIGKPIYEKKTGTKWKYKGWWSKPESLDMSIFDIPTIQKTIDFYNQIPKDDENLIVMVTGRIFKLSDKIETILDFHNLEFDGKFYNRGGDTFEGKISKFNELLSEYPNIEEVNIWEDRIPHAKGFIKWGNNLLDKKIIKKCYINIVD